MGTTDFLVHLWNCDGTKKSRLIRGLEGHSVARNSEFLPDGDIDTLCNVADAPDAHSKDDSLLHFQKEDIIVQ